MPTIEKRAGVDVLVMGTGCRPATEAEVAFSAENAALIAERDALRAAARDVCEWANAAQWALGNETGVPAAKLDALRSALEGERS